MVGLIELKHDGREALGIREIQNYYNPYVPMSKMAAILNCFKNHISSQTVSQFEPKLDGRHRGDMEIQKS